MALPLPPPEIGERFNHWTVIGDEYRVGKRKIVPCRCDCGVVRHVRTSHLRTEVTKSCGCQGRPGVVPRHTANGESGTRLYKVWTHMIDRCANPTDSEYRRYGNRGITVCDEWATSFQPFKEWALSNGYDESLTLDRIDVNGNYEPSNCRWADWTVQQNNRRNNALVTFNGKTQSMAMWARELGMSSGTFYSRYKRGWSVERMITEPVNDMQPKHESGLSQYITFNGRTQTLEEWAEEIHVKPHTLYWRIRHGWDLQRALTKPTREVVGNG